MDETHYHFLASHQYCAFGHRGCHGPVLLNMYETSSMVLIVAELAGVCAEQLQIDVAPNMVRIQGVRQIAPPAELIRIHCLEIPAGPFELDIPINVAINPDAASSRYREGLLELVLPLANVAPHRVVVHVEEGDTA